MRVVNVIWSPHHPDDGPLLKLKGQQNRRVEKTGKEDEAPMSGNVTSHYTGQCNESKMINYSSAICRKVSLSVTQQCSGYGQQLARLPVAGTVDCMRLSNAGSLKAVINDENY